MAGLPKTEWLPHVSIGMYSSKFVQNFTEVGCLALGFSGIGRAGFPKTRWPPIFPLLCTLSAHFPTVSSVVSPNTISKFLGYPHLRVYRILVLLATSQTREQGGTGLIKMAQFMFMFSWTSANRKPRARRSSTQHEHDSMMLFKSKIYIYIFC